MKRLLPNTFVIGAAKCGTTSLWLYLNAHPEIAFSINKEPAFFVRPDYRDRLEWYESLFEEASIIGEASTLYSAHPVHPDVPERIHSLVPDPKLIYMVRDPVERAVSHYVEQVSRGFENRPAAAALMDPDESRNLYLAASSYATQVKRYLEVFPSSSLLIIDQNELRDDPGETLTRVFGFLSVDGGVPAPREETVVRRSDKRRQFSGLGTRLRQTSVAERALRWIWRLPPPVAIRVVGALKRPLSSPIERPILESAEYSLLRNRFGPEADWLREHTGKPFAHWSC